MIKFNKLVIIPICIVLSLIIVPMVAAAAGGIPDAHGVTGEDFGAMVSDLAMFDPGAVAEHVGDCGGTEGMGGMPAAHGVTGKDFGAMVIDLTMFDPGAVAAHICDCSTGIGGVGETVADIGVCGGIPAIHGLLIEDFRDFGTMVNELATNSDPGMVAHHVRDCMSVSIP